MLSTLAASAAVVVAVPAPATVLAIEARVEDAIVRAVLQDDLLASLPFVDPRDAHCVNPAWSERAYGLIHEDTPSLGLPFVAWYTKEEAAASREGRNPRLPWQRPTRYANFLIRNNGQVDVLVG